MEHTADVPSTIPILKSAGVVAIWSLLYMFLSLFMPIWWPGMIAVVFSGGTCGLAYFTMRSQSASIAWTYLWTLVAMTGLNYFIAFVQLNALITTDCGVSEGDHLCKRKGFSVFVLVALGMLAPLLAFLPCVYFVYMYITAKAKYDSEIGVEDLTLKERANKTCNGDGVSDVLRVVYANAPNAEFCDNTVTNTKYTLINFVPKNLLIQFSAFMNVYFLLIACLQLDSELTPVNPLTTWIPLLMIFAVSAIKEAYDDYLRRQRDHRANTRLINAVENGTVQGKVSSSIHPGDIMYIRQDEEIPADCVLLQTSEDGNAYIETANLDGETDLKSRVAVRELQDQPSESVQTFRGVCTCAAPNAEVYVFDSKLQLSTSGDDSVSLSTQQFLLAGTHLRNTEWCYALVVYTGNETKMGQNKKIPRTKVTKLDKAINVTTLLIFAVQLALASSLGVAGNLMKVNGSQAFWYLGYDVRTIKQPMTLPLRFLLLMSFMIPISLKVTLDIVKFYYATSIGWDLEMYDSASNTPAEALNTSISEDLGQIEYIMTDKTGTLTDNIMCLKKISVNAMVYGDQGDNADLRTDDSLRMMVERGDDDVLDFFRCLALCHTVVLESDGSYGAASPDEEALVQAAKDMGVAFAGSKASQHKTMLYSLDVCGRREEHEVLAVLEFSSDRKRMSVITRAPDGRVVLYMKGADDRILARVREQGAASPAADTVSATSAQLDRFAALGLRTLCLGRREIDEDELTIWLEKWQAALTDMSAREQALADVYELVEGNLHLMGATAIEDRLQDQVPSTIATLREAGIKFWMLTGDKYATALQIANACNLTSAGDQILTVADEESGGIRASLERHLQTAMRHPADLAIAIEGSTLGEILRDKPLQALFLKLALMAHAVVCCRVSPQQKALVVRMVKDTGKMCLSIGDGGNDVSMIQEAHIGVGISGREGLQAARAADYSFARFKFLARLLLVHGRYSYIRTAFISQYCFYKSLFICFIQIFYNFEARFSGVSFFNTFCLTTYNVFFTSFPIVGHVLDKDVPEGTVLAQPSLYRVSQLSTQLNNVTRVGWFSLALWHAVIALMLTLATYRKEDANHGAGYESMAMVTYTGVVIVNQCVVGIFSNSLTTANYVLLVGAVVLYFVFTAIYSALPHLAFYQVMHHHFASANFWLTSLLITAAGVLPLLTVKYFRGRSKVPSQEKSSLERGVATDTTSLLADQHQL